MDGPRLVEPHSRLQGCSVEELHVIRCDVEAESIGGETHVVDERCAREAAEDGAGAGIEDCRRMLVQSRTQALPVGRPAQRTMANFHAGDDKHIVRVATRTDMRRSVLKTAGNVRRIRREPQPRGVVGVASIDTCEGAGAHVKPVDRTVLTRRHERLGVGREGEVTDAARQRWIDRSAALSRASTPHTLMVSSSPALANRCPSGDQARLHTRSRCPRMVRRALACFQIPELDDAQLVGGRQQ